VYDDSSPYYEYVVITCAITLMGENKETTIIDGNHRGRNIDICSDGATITGFTLQNAENGIYITTNENTIIGNNILNHHHNGIYLRSNNEETTSSSFNRIENNFISGCEQDGIDIFVWQVSGAFSAGSNNMIINNTLTENHAGISIGHESGKNLVYGNIVMSSHLNGIRISGNLNQITMNHIENNGLYGIELYGPCFNTIQNNNILSNDVDAYFYTTWIHLRSIWRGNYWGRAYLFPKVIIGKNHLCDHINPKGGDKPIDLINFEFDLRPASEPFNIQG